MFVVAVEFEVDPSRIEPFRVAIMTQARNSLAKEPQCQQFDVCFDPDRPDRCFLYEKYDDEAAFAVHRQTPHFADYDATVKPWIKSKSVSLWTQAES